MVIALVGLVIVPASFFQSIGIGAILVVLVALASTLTLLPAVLALLGTRVNFLSLPFLNRAKATSGAGEASRQSFWDWSTRVVTRFPVISIVLVAAPLIALAAFYFQINTGVNTGLNGIDTFPDDAQTKAGIYHPGGGIPHRAGLARRYPHRWRYRRPPRCARRSTTCGT